jgi:branched-chain amino acid transport system substrate-binding protein
MASISNPARESNNNVGNSADGNSGSEVEEVIRIGIIGPLTGNNAFGGNESANAVAIACEMYGEVLGKKVVAETADAGDVTQVMSEFERLYAKGVRFFIGTYGAYADSAIQKVVDERGAFLMSVSSWADELTENKINNYFHYTPRVSVFGTQMAVHMPRYAKEYLGIEKEELRVAVIWNTNVEYVATSALNGLREAGIEPVYTGGYPIDQKDFTALVAQLQSAQIDVLIPCQSSADGIPFRKKMVEMGYEPSMLFAMGMIYDQPDFGDLGSDIVDGCLVLSYTYPSINQEAAPGLAEFVGAYNKKYGWEPLTHATQTYSATVFLLDMIEETGEDDVDKVVVKMESVQIPKGQYPNYWGIEFDEYHRNIYAGDPLVIGQWQKGILVSVGTPEIARGEPMIPWDASKLD